MLGAGGLDDVEVRAAAAPVRRREGRRPLLAARAVAGRAGAPDAPLHLRAAADHRPTGGHPGSGHGHERADDGLDDGHLLDAEGLRRPGDRHRQADLARRLALPPRGDGRRRRDGDRARVPPARLGARRSALRRPGLRQRRRDRRAGARRTGREGDRRLRRLGRDPRRGRARHPQHERARARARLAGRLADRTPDLERGAARARVRHPRARRARGPGACRQRPAAALPADRRGCERPDVAGGRRDPRRARNPRAARHPHERRRRHRLLLRMGAGPRPPLLGPRRDQGEARREAERRVRPRLGRLGRARDPPAHGGARRRHPRGGGRARSPRPLSR